MVISLVLYNSLYFNSLKNEKTIRKFLKKNNLIKQKLEVKTNYHLKDFFILTYLLSSIKYNSYCFLTSKTIVYLKYNIILDVYFLTNNRVATHPGYFEFSF